MSIWNKIVKRMSHNCKNAASAGTIMYN
jgi:hypothetical protein